MRETQTEAFPVVHTHVMIPLLTKESDKKDRITSNLVAYVVRFLPDSVANQVPI